MLTSIIIKTNYGKFLWIRSWCTMKFSMMQLWKRHLRPVNPLLKGQGQCSPSPASLLTAISNHCLVALPAKMSAFNSHMRQNAYYRNLKWTLDLMPCYCCTIKTNRRIIRSQVWQPVSAGKREVMSELQARHCMTPEQWTCLLCSVSVIAVNKLSLQEINQLIRIELLKLGFLENLDS